MTNCPLRDGPRVLYGNVEDSRADIRGWAPREVPTSGARGINWPLRDVYRCTYTEPPFHNRRWEVRKASSRHGTDESLVLQVRKGYAQRGKQGSSKEAPPAVGAVCRERRKSSVMGVIPTLQTEWKEKQQSYPSGPTGVATRESPL